MNGWHTRTLKIQADPSKVSEEAISTALDNFTKECQNEADAIRRYDRRVGRCAQNYDHAQNAFYVVMGVITLISVVGMCGLALEQYYKHTERMAAIQGGTTVTLEQISERRSSDSYE